MMLDRDVSASAHEFDIAAVPTDSIAPEAARLDATEAVRAALVFGRRLEAEGYVMHSYPSRDCLRRVLRWIKEEGGLAHVLAVDVPESALRGVTS